MTKGITKTQKSMRRLISVCIGDCLDKRVHEVIYQLLASIADPVLVGISKAYHGT